MHQSLIEKTNKLAVIGLGYVGLPVALAFGRRISVIGFDINQSKIDELRNGDDANHESAESSFKNIDIEFTSDPDKLSAAAFFIVTVPTPVDSSNQPDLRMLLSAAKTVGAALKNGDYVVFESTTYPGCTEEDCLPVLEKYSGLRAGIDFKIGYSPERINPGDPSRNFTRLPKVVSGMDRATAEEIAAVYGLVLDAGIHIAPSIKVAEAAKVVENTQRDMNIALMNELSMMFDRMQISMNDVLEAAATKWNFLPFAPGLVGGHCTGVDPYYLAHKASTMGYQADLIAAARRINDGMATHVAQKIIGHLRGRWPSPKVLVKGVTFKENVSDIRNSKIADTIAELQTNGIAVEIEDPVANEAEVMKRYGMKLSSGLGTYHAVIITVAHRQYINLGDKFFCSITEEGALIADLKSIYKNNIVNRKYWSL